MQKEVWITGRMKMQNKIKRKGRYAGRIIGGVAVIFLVLIVVPVGAVMFVISGLWSALDRILLKVNR